MHTHTRDCSCGNNFTPIKICSFFLGKKIQIENSSCLQLISLTKPIISTFTPSHVHNHLLLQRGGKSRAGTEAWEKKSTSPNIYPKKRSLWRLNSALQHRRDSASYSAHCLLANHNATFFLMYANL